MDEEDPTRHFTIGSTIRAQGRPHLIHTVESADDVLLTAQLVLQVQWQDRWKPAEEAFGGNVHVVYDEVDPEWVKPSAMVPFARLLRHATRWHDDGGRPECPGCVLRDPVPSA